METVSQRRRAISTASSVQNKRASHPGRPSCSACADLYPIRLGLTYIKGVNRMNPNKPHESQKMYPQNQFALYLTNAFLYDKLHMLSAEYTIPVEELADLAVKRFVEDVELVRNLRTGKAGRE